MIDRASVPAQRLRLGFVCRNLKLGTTGCCLCLCKVLHVGSSPLLHYTDKDTLWPSRMVLLAPKWLTSILLVCPFSFSHVTSHHLLFAGSLSHVCLSKNCHLMNTCPEPDTVLWQWSGVGGVACGKASQAGQLGLVHMVACSKRAGVAAARLLPG